MRKFTEEQRVWFVRRARKSQKRSLKSNRGPIRKGPDLDKASCLASISGRELVELPSKMSLQPKFATQTLDAIDKLSSIVSSGNKVMLDVSNISQMSAISMAYLYSELHELTDRYGKGIVRFYTTGSSRYGRYMMQESGLMALLYESCPPRGDFMPIVSGRKNDSCSEITEFIVERAILDGDLTDDPIARAEAHKVAYRALHEAMLNVANHAYPGENKERQWWVTAAILDKSVNLALCDRGVGIPETLPTSTIYEKFVSFLPGTNVTDAVMIKAAMNYTRTSTGKTSRGLGTKDMQNLVLEREEGHLTIVSGYGHYRLSGKSRKDEIHELERKVNGTVVQWKIPLIEVIGNE